MSGPVTPLDSFKFVRDEVKHEYNVLGSRLTSYITSQSFLVSAFAVAMNNTNVTWGRDWRLIFPLIICSTGLVLSGRAQPGITSAVQIINALHERQRVLHKDPEVQALDWMDPEFMISVHRQSLQFSVLTAYVFTVGWVAMLVASLYLRFRGG